MKTSLVVTSISAPNPILRAQAEGCLAQGWEFLVAGDRKSPAEFAIDGCRFLSLEAQLAGPFRSAALAPVNSYVRKNIAFLEAAASGADIIVETDDDNAPNPGFWRQRSADVSGELCARRGWQNVFGLFSDSFCYPRGFPLDLVRTPAETGIPGTARCPIQQGLVHGNPDVDAIQRLVCPEPPAFRERPPVILDPGVWCPFNSQNTATFREAFPLLYLPATCTFRATDIWRGLVAQRVMWSAGWRLSFHSADVIQIRNPHNLLADFADEIPVYLHSGHVAAALDALSLPAGPGHVCDNLRVCYQAMIRLGTIDAAEEGFLDAWINDLTASGWAPTAIGRLPDN